MVSGPATANDIFARSIVPVDAGLANVLETLLDDAYALLVNADPSIPGRLADEAQSAALTRLVVLVQCAMVGRVARNPEGKLEETIDDYRYRLDSAVSSGSLYFSGDELARLALPHARRRRSAFSIVLGNV